jgi:transcriptional regulator with XRE-family HTH domain
MNKYIKIGERLRKLRAHLSQKEFAEKIAMPLRTYIYYESGERMPKGDVLYRIATICGIPVEWIMTGEVEYKEVSEDEIRHRLHIEGATKEEIDVFIKARAEQKKDIVSKESAIYNRCSDDPELYEIMDILQRDLPEAKKLVLKLLKGRKEFKEGLRALQTIDNNLLKEEG